MLRANTLWYIVYALLFLQMKNKTKQKPSSNEKQKQQNWKKNFPADTSFICFKFPSASFQKHPKVLSLEICIWSQFSSFLVGGKYVKNKNKPKKPKETKKAYVLGCLLTIHLIRSCRFFF